MHTICTIQDIVMVQIIKTVSKFWEIYTQGPSHRYVTHINN